MADLIVTGSIAEVAKGTIKYGEQTHPISVSTIQIAEVFKGTLDGERSIRVLGIDESDFVLRINAEVEQDEADDSPKVPLSMRTGLFLISRHNNEETNSIAPAYAMRVYDITDSEARDGLVPIVRSFVALEAIEDPLKRRAAFLEWIVQCTENSATRRDGFYEFSRADQDRRWRVNSEDNTDRDAVEAKVAFTDGQIDRLLDVWVAALEKREEGAMWFGGSLGEYRGEIVAQKLLDTIAAEGEGGSSDVGTWMQIVSSIYEWRSGHLLTQQLWESEDTAVRAKIVQRFLELAPYRGEIPEAVVGEGSEDEATESADDVESEAVTEMEDIEREAVEALEQAGTDEEGAEAMDLVDLESPVVIELESPNRPDGND